MISLSKVTSPIAPPPSTIFANFAKFALLSIAVLLLSLPTFSSLPNLTIVTPFSIAYHSDLSLHRPQSVQNALARVVVPTVSRSHHISPTLRSSIALAFYSPTHSIQDCFYHFQNLL